MYDLDILFDTLYFIGQMEYNIVSIAVFTNYKFYILMFLVLLVSQNLVESLNT